MPFLPAGTITFLFTDIEGSTKLWEEQPDAMRLALARHDALMRQAIEDNAGVVFKTVGDAFCAAFATAPDALNAALQAQIQLDHGGHGEHEEDARKEGANVTDTASDLQGHASAPALTLASSSVFSVSPVVQLNLRVRMALHTGAAQLRDNDYFGPPLNRVARLLAAGHGGQTLLSDVTHDLSRDTLPPLVTIRSLGEHRLRDLSRPESIFQLLHPALPADFAPLRGLENPATPNNLPQQLTSFVGREREMDDIKTLLAKTRLLTLTGMGGSGKTRLSLQAAADTLDAYPQGAWLVELASLSDPTLVPQTVAQILGVSEEPGKPLTAALANALKDRKLLLVLDNCEHLVDACARLADALLKSCPDARILASSREALNIAGEQTYRVPSLSLPDARQPQTIASVTQYAAVRLFIDRALAVQPAFTVTNQNAPALAQLCAHLDGIPLAIELAAARIRSLSVEEINSRLDNRFRLLTGGSRASLPRQQTLRALIDWSYDLLNAQEKALLCRLSVFAGGWALDAAEIVGADADIEDWEILDLLTSLADKSLVVPQSAGVRGQTRYGLLESVRQYARDRLAESGTEAPTRERQRAFFTALAHEAKPHLEGPEQAQWLDRLEAEHDNLRAALDWGGRPDASATDGEATLEMAGALFRFWEVRGYFTEGRARLEGALALPGGETQTRARVIALHAVGTLAAAAGDYAYALGCYEQSGQMAQALGDLFYLAVAKQQSAVAAEETGDPGRAALLLGEAIALYQQQGRADMVANNQSNLAVLAITRGNFVQARDLLTQALRTQRGVGDLRSIAITLNNLGDVERGLGDYARARACQAESLQITLDIGARRSSAYALEAFADIAVDEAQWEQAVILWSAAHHLRETSGCPRTPADSAELQTLIDAVKARLGEVQFAEFWNRGAVPLEQALRSILAGIIGQGAE